MFNEIYVALQASRVLQQRMLEEARQPRRGWFKSIKRRDLSGK